MIVLNFIFVLAFAALAEYLRSYVFKFSKIINWKKNNQQTKKVQSEERQIEKVELTQDQILEKIDNEELKQLYTLHLKCEKSKADLQKQKDECEQYNNQDQYVKYAKLQRQMVKSQKQSDKEKKDIVDKIMQLSEQDKDQFDKILKGEFAEDDKPDDKEEVSKSQQPSFNNPASMIDKDYLMRVILFYLVFYFIPMILIPFVKKEDYDYLVYTGLYIAPENPEIPNYKAQIPTGYNLFKQDEDYSTSPYETKILFQIVKPITRVFKLVKLEDIVMTFVKIDYAYMIALVAVSRFHEIIQLVFYK